MLRGIHETLPGSGIYFIQYSDHLGKRHREKAGDFEDAVHLLRIRTADALRRKPRRDIAGINVNAALFGELIDDASAYAYRNNDPYVALDLSRKFELMRPTFGNIWADSILKSDIEEWLDKHAAEREWKPSSRNRYQSAFSLIFRVGMDSGKVSKNPASGIRTQQEDNSRVRYLSRDEEDRITAAINELYPEYLPLFNLSVQTGMRLSEQLRSVAGDFNPDSGTLAVRQKKNRRAPTQRHVPMTPIAIEAYKKLVEGKRPGELLCKDKDGYPMTGFSWFDRVLDKAGVEDFTWHCNRHTFASRLVMSGVPIAAVSKFLGHSNIQQTMRYSHLMADTTSAAVAAMMGYYKAA